MPRRCIVGGCSNTKKSKVGVTLHGIPSDSARRQLWIRQLRTTRSDLSADYFANCRSDSVAVCSDHFRHPDDFQTEFYLKEQFGMPTHKRLKPDAVPSIFPRHEKSILETERDTRCRTHPQACSTPKKRSRQDEREAFRKREHSRVLSDIFNQALAEEGMEEEECEVDTNPETVVTSQPSRKETRSVRVQVSEGRQKKNTKHKKCQTKLNPETRSIGIQVDLVAPAVQREEARLPKEASEDESNTSVEVSHFNDTLYCPSTSTSEGTSSGASLSSGCNEKGNPPGLLLTEDKFIIFKSNLLELFSVCRHCRGPAVGKIAYTQGSFVCIQQECFVCTQSFKWYNQPLIGDTPAGNIALSAAILCAGATPSQFLRTLQHIKIASPHLSTFMKHQQHILTPAVHLTYQNERHKWLAAVKVTGEPLTAAADGRCDSPGHSAKYLSYTIMDASCGKVLHIELVQSNEVKSSCHMEKEGLIRAVEALHQEDIKIGTIITDRHVQIKAWIRDNLAEVRHHYDIWHVAKSIRRKVEGIAKLKGCEELQPWIRSISNHLYWSAASEQNGTGEAILAKWQSVANHIQNVHTDHGPLFPTCLHAPVEDVQYRWLKPGSKAAVKFEELVMKKTLANDVKKLSPNFQTSGLEAFHSVINHFCPKLLAFSHMGMRNRLYMAALHFNENVKRPQACTKSGEKKFSIQFPKYKKGEPVVKEIKECSTYAYVHKVLEEVERQVVQRSKISVNMPPPLCNQYVRPDKATAVASHLSRFNPPQH